MRKRRGVFFYLRAHTAPAAAAAADCRARPLFLLGLWLLALALGARKYKRQLKNRTPRACARTFLKLLNSQNSSLKKRNSNQRHTAGFSCANVCKPLVLSAWAGRSTFAGSGR